MAIIKYGLIEKAVMANSLAIHHQEALRDLAELLRSALADFLIGNDAEGRLRVENAYVVLTGGRLHPLP